MRRSLLAFLLVGTGLLWGQDSRSSKPFAGLDAVARRHLAADFSVGFVLGALRDGKTWVRGYGTLGPDADEAPSASTVYEIGSITKVFTGILLAEAVRRGEVKLEDPVEVHLPKGASLPAREGRKIRLVDLATHHSGLPRMPLNWRPVRRKNPYVDYGKKDLFSGLADTKLASVPGTTYAYSNYAFGLLGQILVDRAGLADFDALLAARITGPLGMKETGCRLGEALKKRRAAPCNARRRVTHAWDFDALAGCGAIRSTVPDLLRFARANLAPADDPLGASLRAAQKVRARDAGRGVTTGLGWHFASGGARLWHNGGTGGYRSMLILEPEKKCAVVVLANTTSRRVDRLGTDAMAALTAN